MAISSECSLFFTVKPLKLLVFFPTRYCVTLCRCTTGCSTTVVLTVALMQHYSKRCCIDVTSQQKVLQKCNTPVDLSIFIVVEPGPFSFDRPPQSQPVPLKVFEPLWSLWSLWSLWASLKAVEDIEGHWSHWTLWIDRTPSNLMQDSPGSLRSVPKYINWSHAGVLGTWLSVCSDRCPPQRPPVVYIFNSIWCFGLSVNQK